MCRFMEYLSDLQAPIVLIDSDGGRLCVCTSNTAGKTIGPYMSDGRYKINFGVCIRHQQA